MVNSRDEKITRAIATVVMSFLAICALLPFILLIIASFTDNGVAVREGYSFFPSQFSLSAYQYLAQQWSMLGKGYLMTIVVTVLGTTIGLTITSMLAYALTVPGLPGRKVMSFMIILSMLFHGGIVASYYVYSNLIHIKDTIWALVMPGMLMSAFNIILMRNFFSSSISSELMESARIDGAGEIKIFAKIVIPLSVPILATVGLMQAVGYWNEWTNGMYYLTKRNGSQYYTIQLILNQLNEDIQFLSSNAAQMGLVVDTSNLPTTTMRMAVAVVAILPLLIAYPFFQKYFVKGITLGAVKG